MFHTSTGLVFLIVTLFPSVKADFFGWKPDNSSRSDLLCPKFCEDDRYPDDCCICNALPCWKINSTACGASVGQLYVERIDQYNSVVVIPMKFGNNTHHELTHAHGRLRKLPGNICDFSDTLVEVDFSDNKLVDISGLKCLIKLDTLRLDSNQIFEIPNGTFSEMESLRILTLSNNKLLNLKPFTFKIKQGNIFTIDLSNNFFNEVDVTNIIRPGRFCSLDLTDSQIRVQTNSAKYNISSGGKHGPGTVNLTSTLGTWLNFTQFGLNDYRDFGKYIDVGFRWDQSSINCDCNLVPFMRALGKNVSQYWPDIVLDLQCETPEELKGTHLTELYYAADYDALVCPLPNCPHYCSCTDVQSLLKVVVKCQGLTEFPDFMPVGFWGNNKIELILENNDITELPDRDYLDRLKVLNLKDCPISKISSSAVDKLRGNHTPISLTNHSLQRLPEVMYKMHPDDIDFGETPVDCDCDNLWVGDWIRLKSSKKENASLKCRTPEQIVPAYSVTSDLLACPKPEPEIQFRIPIAVIVSAIVLVSIIIFVAYYFRYEIMLLKRKVTYRANVTDYTFDAYISYSDENIDLNKWVREYLRNPLKEVGYSVFVGLYDILPGDDPHVCATEAIKNSKSYIVILNNKYKHDENSIHEFETIWKYFAKDTKRQIVLINFDHMESSEISDPRLKAFVRIGWELNYEDRETRMFDRLLKRLGPRPKSRNRSNMNLQDVEDSMNQIAITPARQRNTYIPSNNMNTRYKGAAVPNDVANSLHL